MFYSIDDYGNYTETYYQTLTLRPEWEYTPSGGYGYHIYDDANLVVYDFAYEQTQSGGSFASRSDKYLDGHGRVRAEIAYGKDYVLDVVTTKHDNLGRLWQQSRPYRSGDPPLTTYAYDGLDRVKTITAPDGSVVKRFYNQHYESGPNAPYPSAATQGTAGQTVLAVDPWNRERWARFDEQNRLVEMVEPDPNGATGSVATGGMKTNYSYDTLGNLTLVTQGAQTRSFKYDALSRLTHQKLAEREAKLNDAGGHVEVVGGTGVWSDVFHYDQRSNLDWRVEARGVKTILNYNSDPLNRLQSVQYDKSGVPGALVGNIPDAPSVNYYYMTSGDKTRLQSYAVSDGMGSETLAYDSYGRLYQATQTFAGRTGYPVVKNYTWDSLDRMQKLTNPLRHGTSDVVRREMTLAYDMASRIDSLKYDDVQTGQVFASSPTYNAASQTESLTIGSPTVGARLTETYTYDTKTGLLTTQKVTRQSDSAVFVDLQYNYTLNNDAQNNGAKSGQLTSATDLQNQTRNRAYEYDKLGRLKKVKGGVNAFYSPDWWQSYGYDLYGNRTSVMKTGGGSNIPLDGLASLSASTTSNRITSANFEYDAAGNQTKAVIDASSTVQQYRYDAAGRLAQVLNGSGGVLATYSYGANNQRLMSVEGGVTTYYGWDGGQVLAEYAPAGASGLSWQTGYVYLGGRLLATMNGAAGSGTRFHHPDRLGTRIVTDQSNAELVTVQAGMPFGTQQPAGSFGGDNSWQHATKNNPSKKRFTSYDRSDATGLDYAVNRFYSAGQGRFTQVDPIGMSAASLEDPQTLNLYSYCGNDPVNHVDPDGLFWGRLFGWFGKAVQWAFRIAAVIVAVIAVMALASLGEVWGSILITKGVVALLFGSAGLLATAGWAPGKLGQLAGALVTLGVGGNFRTPDLNPSGGVGGVNDFQRARRPGRRRGGAARQAAQAALSVKTVQSLVRANNQARDAGVDDAVVVCQAWRESSFRPAVRPNPRSQFRGLLQVGRPATQDAGFSNQDHERIESDPALGIRIGTTYLRARVERARGNVETGLDRYNGEARLRGIYGTQITNCARMVREGRVQDGLHSIHR